MSRPSENLRKSTFSITLDPKDIESLKVTAKKNELPPRVFARQLLLKGLRVEMDRLSIVQVRGP